LDCTQDVKKELAALDWRSTDVLKRRLTLADKMAMSTAKQYYREEWEGLVATAAEAIVELAPKAANVLRNRRLMFIGAPELSRDAGYSMADFLTALRK
jgi:hypothetical protein